jgi:glycosyltransferase involved in cell wall biosynthesis
MPGAPSESGPLVSVIMPFLDTPSDFLRQAVASVLDQSYPHWELVLVNDGSGSETTATALQLAREHAPHIRYVTHPGGINRGIPASRNAGMAVAEGELVAFLDSDDVWLPHKLADQVALLAAHPRAAMVFGRSIFWRSWQGGAEASRDEVPPLCVPDGTVLPPPEFVRKFIRMQVMTPCPSSILVRRSAAAEVGGFAEVVSNMYEDQAFYAKIGLAFPVLASETVWDRYRLHGASVLGSASAAEADAARREFIGWLRSYLESNRHNDPGLIRSLTVDRYSMAVPRGPRMLRSIRRLVRFSSRCAAAVPGIGGWFR